MAHAGKLLRHLPATAAALAGGGAAALGAPGMSTPEPRRAAALSPRRPRPVEGADGRPWGGPSPSVLCEGADAAVAATEARRFAAALSRHRARIATYRDLWEYRADSAATTATATPSRSWPNDVPADEELPRLVEDAAFCRRVGGKGMEFCDRLAFRAASGLVVQSDEDQQRQGLELLKSLAATDYPDAIAYYGMCLNEGRVAGHAPDADAAVALFQACAELGHPQGMYELGVAYYMGEGVQEDEAEAARLFRAAADQDHPAACYMLGDCLLDGTGVDVDRAAALEWLVRAAELGHRGARSRVMAVLEKREGQDYDGFTDASRQTLAARRPTTGGAGDRPPPGELTRRRTIVGRSREGS